MIILSTVDFKINMYSQTLDSIEILKVYPYLCDLLELRLNQIFDSPR